MSVTVHTVCLCSVTVLQCKWPRALLLLLNIFVQHYCDVLSAGSLWTALITCKLSVLIVRQH